MWTFVGGRGKKAEEEKRGGEWKKEKRRGGECKKEKRGGCNKEKRGGGECKKEKGRGGCKKEKRGGGCKKEKRGGGCKGEIWISQKKDGAIKRATSASEIFCPETLRCMAETRLEQVQVWWVSGDWAQHHCGY